MAQIAVEMCNITKIFPGMYRSIIANDRVDLSVGDGEFHVIVGENGAGKSTLMNVLYGLLEPDEGEVRLFGDTVKLASPKIALEHGIGMIHQHFMLVPSFTIGENIVLGSEPTRVTLLDRRRIRQAVNVLAEELKLEVDPDTPIWDTTVGVQQRVEI
ncbi:MAG: ATP-binding cassette domain-containing protein, partial [Anaerolineales bacterium]|nr:ATP-binding cassette domain-containing protein [Anaerolineales bacterium]